jgi:hypothetical protein
MRDAGSSGIKYKISFEEFILIKKGFSSANKQKLQKVVITETKDGSCDVKFDYNKTVLEIQFFQRFGKIKFNDTTH